MSSGLLDQPKEPKGKGKFVLPQNVLLEPSLIRLKTLPLTSDLGLFTSGLVTLPCVNSS